MAVELIKGLNPYNEPEFYRLPGVRRDFSGTTPIIGNGSLTSGVVQVSGYAYFISEIKADQPCTITMYWYSDSAGSNLLDTVAYSYATPQGLRLISGSVSADYLKIIITNTTATNMTTFWHRLKLSASPSINLAEVETNQEQQLVALADIEQEINDELLATRNTIESVGEELEANITAEQTLTRATIESVGEELETQINLVTTEINDELATTRATIESVGEELEANITAEHALTRTEINDELATTRATIESVGEEIEASLLAVQNEVSDEALATRNTIESVGEELELSVAGVTTELQKFNFSTDGKLIVDEPPHISTSNSSTATLGSGAVFTGTAEQVNGYGIIYISVFANVASAANGLAIQQSIDGTNWDHSDEFTVPANKGKNFSINPHAKYFRVVYTNGGTAQATFRLQTILKVTGKPSSHRIQDSISDDDDAELVKAVMTGKNPAGTFVNFAATTAGNFKVSIEEFENAVSVNSNSQLRVTPYHADGSAGALLTGTDYIAGKSGIDASTESLQTIGYEHHEIHAGSHFMLCNYVDLSINQVYDIQITTPNTTKESHLVFGIEVESETIIQLFEDVTIATAGSALGVRNNNRNSATVTGMTVNGILNSSTANADADTVISAATIMEQSIVGVGKGSLGSVTRENEIVLKKNARYSIRFTATAAGYINYCLHWYEHTPKN